MVVEIAFYLDGKLFVTARQQRSVPNVDDQVLIEHVLYGPRVYRVAARPLWGYTTSGTKIDQVKASTVRVDLVLVNPPPAS